MTPRARPFGLDSVRRRGRAAGAVGGRQLRIDNLRLQTKALIPLLVMSLAVFGIVGFGAYRLDSLARSAGEIIAHRDKAAILVARATGTTMMAPYSVFGALVYDGSSPEGRTAQSDFTDQIDKLDSQLDAAAEYLPDYASSFADFKKSFHEMADKAKKPVAIGEDSPGLAVGKDLKPEDLDKLAEGAQEVTEVDNMARKLKAGLLSVSDTMINENARSAADMARQSQFALITLIVAGLVSALVAGGLTIWISTMKTARPLAELARRMNALASGDHSVEVGGRERRDEIGDMARAIQVFKEHAIERLQLEASATATRRGVEEERERVAAERLAAAEEQAEVVRRLSDGLKTLAEGDLVVRLGDGFSTTYAQIRDDFNEAVAKLSTAIAAVALSAGAMQTESHSVASAADDLSRRTEQQAASLEETAATLGTITDAVRKSAEGADQARVVVTSANDDAQKSAAVVRKAVEAMNAISKSSEQIGQIIGVIDEIAFQTNLLALNAGVEAARAGDAGRGFAVVASEVRALAQRSAEAAKEIKSLISASTTQVNGGVALVAETGRSLERILAQMGEINAAVKQTAAGTQEQATALQQVNVAIDQMNRVTQENAAMVEETTAAGRSLSDDAAGLSRLIGQFQFDGSTGNAAVRRKTAKNGAQAAA
ncbi:MAG: methyl-accepting chemotaxis protein [Bradyrhizobium sp.]|nr:MAG: methyl-accepting chemotaxis protein [Bradyrhizobium sp.]